MNMYTFSVTLCCILFCFFLAIVYFFKKNMSNIENKIYKYLVILDFIILIFGMICLIVGNYIKDYDIMMSIYDVSARIYCVSQLLWYIALITYTIVIISDKDEFIYSIISGKNNKIFNFLKMTMIIAVILTFLLPVRYSFSDDGIISYSGLRSNFMNVFLFILAIIGMACIIINWKKITNKKKIYPFIMLVFMQIIAYLAFLIDNTINILPLSITLISYLMYHTIENPDLKLITELEAAKNEAEEANNEKSAFLSSMSHEIRTPLNAIVGLSELIHTSDNLEDIHSDSKDMVVASRNLLELINTILDINQLEENKIQLFEQDYKPKELFLNLEKIINQRIGNKQLELRTNISKELPEVLYGDKEKLQRIIFNLLTNAVKYTERGYIDFIVDCNNKEEKANLTITIKDTGRGIKEDQKDKLFHKFYRLEEDRDSDIEGTGLGLAITKLLVELFKGEISIDSVYGQGTTITIKIAQIISERKSETEITQEIEELI